MKVFVLLYIRGKLQNPIFGNILNGFKKGLIDFEIDFVICLSRFLCYSSGKASKSKFWQYLKRILKRDSIDFEIVFFGCY